MRCIKRWNFSSVKKKLANSDSKKITTIDINGKINGYTYS